ncbi:MAG: type II secretion system GspH family protein [Bifidobacterium minimum]|nr:type II secretion system GspH family protein [Bifidobacterium minimum]
MKRLSGSGGSPSRGQRGFTLVEVIVAIVILTGVGLAAAQFAITAIRSSTANQQRSEAVSVSASALEDVHGKVGTQSGTVDAVSAIAGASSSLSSSCTAGERAVLGSSLVDSSAMDVKAISVRPARGSSSSSYSDATASGCSGTTGLAPAIASTTGSGTAMNVYTVVGTCVRASGSADCVRRSSSGAPSGGSTMVRVVVIVAWPDVLHQGAASTYSSTMLLDDAGASATGGM